MIKIYGSNWVKGHRGQRSNLCCFFFLFVPPRSLGRSSPNLEGRWRAAPDISLRGSFLARLHEVHRAIVVTSVVRVYVYVYVCVRVRVTLSVKVF